MLRNLLLISSSGIVLYSKEFIKAVAKPGLIGGLITAMLDFSEQRTGLPVSYIELATVGVSVVRDKGARVTCALFYDREDGQEFGQLIASEILRAFVQTYSSPNEEKISATGAEDFSGFNMRISETIRNSVRPVLDTLQQQRGILLAVLISGDTITHSTYDVDKIGILANIQALLGVATDIMTAKNDLPVRLTLKSERNTVFLIRLEGTSLVVVTKNSVKHDLYEPEIDNAAKLLRQVLIMSSNLQDAWHIT